MLGLGLALSIAKKTLGDAIDGLLSTLRGRATYYENGSASKSTIKAIDNADVLDKATILLTPTATSDALVHCVKDNTSDSDFDFDRASSATRINSSGLVQDMQSITDPELVLNGDFEELGSELVTNGDYSDAGVGNATSQSNGVLVNENNQLKITSAGGAFSSYARAVWATGGSAGDTFVVEADIISISGSVRFYDQSNNGTYADLVAGSTYKRYIVLGSGDKNLGFGGNNDVNFELVLDNVSVKQVDPNDRWTLDTGWSIEDGVASCDGTSGASIYQNISGVQNNIYAIIVTVSNYTSGTLQIGGSSNNLEVNANGTYTHYRTWTSDGNLYFKSKSGDGFTGSIDNISVKDITFSEDVDLARINYDSNGENGHILLEPTSTNLITYSEDFENGYTKVNSSVDLNDAVAPDGTTTANKFNSTALASKVHKSHQNSSALFHTVSIFLKKGTIDIVSLEVSGASPDINASTTVNLTSGTITASSGNGSITPTITNYGNDWYRITASSTSNGNVANPTIFIVNSSTTASGYFYMWGLQFEGLSYATSYIPTLTGSTVTRAAETLTGSGNSTLINSTEGVLYAEIADITNDNLSDNNLISIAKSTDEDFRVSIAFKTNGAIQGFIREGAGNTKLDVSTTTVLPSTSFFKVAVLFESGNNKLYVNGLQIGSTDTSTFSNLQLNSLQFNRGDDDKIFYGKCKALAVFNEALSDTELENLTS